MEERSFSAPVSLADMYHAYECCRKNKKNKRGTKKFEVNALFNVQTLTDEINRKKYKLSPAQCFVIQDPVPREVFCANFRDRVVQHFVFNELNPVIEKMLVYDTANCRVGKGTDFAIRRVQRQLRTVTADYSRNAWYLKADLSGFFMKIDRQLLLEKVHLLIRERYRGKYADVLYYLTRIIVLTDVTGSAIRMSPTHAWDDLPQRKTLFGNPNGLPIGNICSQLFANLYLNDIDHFIKSRHRNYSRYVDDMILLDSSRERLLQTKNLLAQKLRKINMELNGKTLLGHTEHGIRYLGVVIRPYYAVNGKKRISRILSTEFSGPEEAYLSLCSRKGFFQHYHGRHLARRWYASFPAAIRAGVKLNGDLSAAYLKKTKETHKCGGVYPMGIMQTYEALREQNRDCVIFFQRGMFYQLYFYDAQLAAEKFGMKLLWKVINGIEVPVCGMPVKASEKFEQRFAQAGYRVAVCKRLEGANGAAVWAADHIAEPPGSPAADYIEKWDLYRGSCHMPPEPARSAGPGNTKEKQNRRAGQGNRSLEERIVKELRQTELNELTPMKALSLIEKWQHSLLSNQRNESETSGTKDHERT